MSASLTQGSRIHKYELLEKLGEGGMGVVWKARDAVLDRPVAIKIIHQHFSINADMRRRFIDEARTQAKLMHPNICTVLDAFDDDETLCIVQEFIDGQPIKHIIQKHAGPLDTEHLIRWSFGILSALAYAYDAGVIHRDIKPANIMVDKSGVVKIVDFGIAKSVAADRLGKTRTGMTVGTPEYMSPEQILGNEVDARTDIYSFGMTLYEMITGTLPFSHTSSEYEIKKFHISGAPPLTTLPPSKHAEQFKHILSKCLAKQPEQPFDSARAIIAALQVVTTPPPPVSAKSSGIFSAWIVPVFLGLVISTFVILHIFVLIKFITDSPNMVSVRRWLQQIATFLE